MTDNYTAVQARRALLTLAAILSLSPAIIAASAAGTPKHLVEREFRQLETTLGRYVYSEVLTSPDMDRMNRALFDFMRENPGVVRMLRVNAGGHTVNDVSANSPHSAPSRNISRQRWFQHVAQTRRPYYSMDADSAAGAISLFYAWPLFTGPDRTVFSGAFAAMIDLTAQTALIDVDQTLPFQLAYRGRPFFQHEWDGADYIEEPLEIRGTRNITIHTIKPLATRLDPITRTPSARRADENYENGDNENGDFAILSDGRNAAKTGITSLLDGGIVNTAVVALLLLIALLLAYSILQGRSGKAKRFVRNDPAPPHIPEGEVVIVRSISEPPPTPKQAPAPLPEAEEEEELEQMSEPKPPQNADGTINERFIDTIIMDTVPDKSEQGKSRPEMSQQEMITKMLKLIRQDFNMIDKKIEILARRVNDLERFHK
jgi:hypothetical protein